MKKKFRKVVAVILTMAMTMSVGMPAFAAEMKMLTKTETEELMTVIENDDIIQAPTVYQIENMDAIISYAVMDLTKSSSILWQESFINERDIDHHLSCSWNMNDSSNKYMNIFLVNDGTTDIQVTIMKDSAVGNVNALAGTPVNLPAGKQVLFTLNSNEFISRMSNTLVYGDVYVNLTNLDLDEFSVTARAVFYKE